MELHNLVSFLGMFVLLAIAWGLSAHRRTVNWRVVIWGVGLQLAFGLFLFVFPAGIRVFRWLNDVVVKVLQCAAEGSYFVFAKLAIPPGVTRDGQQSLGFILAFQALPMIIFFAALTAVLYHLKIMPMVVRGFAWVFTKLMSISGAESLCASSNIFVGIESAVTVRPYLDDMTDSEFCTILTAGMATIASSVLGFYVFILQGQFPTIAGHLVSASLLSAPAAIVMSKLLLPETGKPRTLGVDVDATYEKDDNLVAAVINGANTGMKLTLSIVALLIAFLGLVALVDLLLQLFSDRSGTLVVAALIAVFAAVQYLRQPVGMAGKKPKVLLWVVIVFGALVLSRIWLKQSGMELTLRNILSVAGYPFALIIGVPAGDAAEIGRLIGQRAVLTEVVSYQDLASLLESKALASPRSQVIAAYALCGFAHVASLAIFVGGISALVPSRASDLARVSPRALLAATLACLMTGAVAGTFFSQRPLLLGGG